MQGLDLTGEVVAFFFIELWYKRTFAIPFILHQLRQTAKNDARETRATLICVE